MAKGARKSIDEKICEKQEIIDALTIRLEKEKSELKALLAEQKLARLEELDELIRASDLSLEDVVSILKESTLNKNCIVA